MAFLGLLGVLVERIEAVAIVSGSKAIKPQRYRIRARVSRPGWVHSACASGEDPLHRAKVYMCSLKDLNLSVLVLGSLVDR